MEKYVVIFPDGNLEEIAVEDHEQLLATVRQIIGCDGCEFVRSRFSGFVMLVDECGRIKCPPQPFNPVASPLYGGFPFDGIYGTVVVGMEGFYRGEPDIVGLSDADLLRLHLLLGRLLDVVAEPEVQ